MDGMLLIDKPAGWTSFDVVAKVRGELKRGGIAKPKVGHTGTLDPLAVGLLVLVLGGYCKRAGEFSQLDKTYEVTMRLGQTSTTGDAEGAIQAVSNKEPQKDEIESALMGFIGEIEQVPPIYSAVKVEGQRAYKLARAGKEVKLAPRKVTINGIKVTDYRYPELKFTADVSSGTYIRSLVVDIGQNLGTGAYMSELRRTAVGSFDVASALSVEGLSPEAVYGNLRTID